MNDSSKSLAVYEFKPFEVVQVEYRSPRRESPRPRSGHRIVTDGKYLWSYGGYNPSLALNDIEPTGNPTWTREKPLFKELWRFNLATKKWKLMDVRSNMPEELASCAVCIAGKTMLIYGGTGTPFGHSCSNTLLTYKTDHGHLEVCECKGDLPLEQYGHAVMTHGKYFYTLGGTNGFAYNCDIYRLDLESKIWESVFISRGDENEPAGRYRHELAFYDNEIYILGGGTGDGAYDLLEIPKFNLEKRCWSKVKSIVDDKTGSAPSSRRCHSAVQIDTEHGPQVFIFGGTDGVVIFNDVWRLDLNTLRWALMEKSRFPHVFFHAATVTEQGCMYAFGGIELERAEDRRSERLHKVWLSIPKLSEMCWEAILHYNPDISNYSPRCLLQTGIPTHLVDRLK